ncbi:hypothetical protein AOLI_G00267200 [Acnodon oligacanthus]
MPQFTFLSNKFLNKPGKYQGLELYCCCWFHNKAEKIKDFPSICRIWPLTTITSDLDKGKKMYKTNVNPKLVAIQCPKKAYKTEFLCLTSL